VSISSQNHLIVQVLHVYFSPPQSARGRRKSSTSTAVSAEGPNRMTALHRFLFAMGHLQGGGASLGDMYGLPNPQDSDDDEDGDYMELDEDEWDEEEGEWVEDSDEEEGGEGESDDTEVSAAALCVCQTYQEVNNSNSNSYKKMSHCLCLRSG